MVFLKVDTSVYEFMHIKHIERAIIHPECHFQIEHDPIVFLGQLSNWLRLPYFNICLFSALHFFF